MIKDRLYLFWRILKGKVARLCYIAFSVLPLRKQVCVCTFEGKGGFCCSSRYIIETLHEKRPDVKCIWLVNDIDCFMPDYVKKVRNSFLNRLFWLSTSRVWIDNYRKPLGTRKRNNQFYLNTWHGSIFIKPLGLWRKKAFSNIAYRVSKNDSESVDMLLVDSRWGEEAAEKGLLYNGVIFRSGLPRQDVLFGDRKIVRKKYRERYHLPSEVKIVMYAPTFRETSVNGKRKVYSEDSSIDYKKLIKALTDKFGGKWCIFVRLHPQLSDQHNEDVQFDFEETIVDVTKEDDMYQLLAATDVYVTDYSSTAFEAGYAKIPVFVYADDVNTYTSSRGELMWDVLGKGNPNFEKKTIRPGDMSKLPFSVAATNEELIQNIMTFDSQKYSRDMDRFMEQVGVVFDGKAGKRVTDVILRHI